MHLERLLDEFLACHHVAQSPPRHCVRLGKALAIHDFFSQILKPDKARSALVVNQLVVAFVADDEHIAFFDLFVNIEEGLFVKDCACGVVGACEYDCFGFVGNDGGKSLFRYLKVVGSGVQLDVPALAQLDDGLVHGKGGHGNYDLVALVDNGKERAHYGFRAARSYHNFVFVVIHSVELFFESGNFPAKLRHAHSGRVKGFVVFQRDSAGVLNLLRGVEIRLAESEKQLGALLVRHIVEGAQRAGFDTCNLFVEFHRLLSPFL